MDKEAGGEILKTMKTAFSYWDKRIAPVFDTAPQIHLIESLDQRIIASSEDLLTDRFPARKVLGLRAQGVETLVCGAISCPLREMINAYGIKVIPFVAGDLDVVIRAYLSGSLESGNYFMPGCRGRRVAREGGQMNGNGQGNGGGGGRRAGRGRMDGTAKGQGGNCRCPSCGYVEPHQRGVPCTQQRCKQCGSAMIRE
jgi:predicted Fe-Mo cluster-binding NifX family protein